jgi:hypothetical protein
MINKDSMFNFSPFLRYHQSILHKYTPVRLATTCVSLISRGTSPKLLPVLFLVFGFVEKYKTCEYRLQRSTHVGRSPETNFPMFLLLGPLAR